MDWSDVFEKLFRNTDTDTEKIALSFTTKLS
jgi:hypothetical protein